MMHGFVAVAAFLSSAAAAPVQPNILLIVADDLGFADIDFQPTTRSVVQTQHLRELALGGAPTAKLCEDECSVLRDPADEPSCAAILQSHSGYPAHR